MSNDRRPLSSRLLSSDDTAAWLEGNAQCPWRGFFSRPEWLDSFPPEWDGPLRLVGVFQDEYLIAGAAFTERRIAGRRVWTMHPMAPYSGFWIAEPEKAARSRLESLHAAVVRSLDSFLSRTVSEALLRLDPWAPEVRAFSESGWEARPLHTYVTELRGAEGREMHFENDARRQIAKARERGIAVREDGDWPSFHRLVNSMMTSKNIDQSYPFTFIEQFSNILNKEKRGRLFTAFDSASAPLASAVIVWENGRATYLFGASAPESRGTGAPSLLQAEIISWLRENTNLAFYDWQGANAPSSARFKKNFNPALRDYFEVRRTYSLPLALARAGRDAWRRWKRGGKD